MSCIFSIISQRLNISQHQVKSTVALLDNGATVPFIARYRKEATLGLDDTQLRLLARELTYLRELSQRKKVIVQSINKLGMLTPKIQFNIQQSLKKSELEAIYHPFKQTKQDKVADAIAAGLEKLTLLILSSTQVSAEKLAIKFINPNKGINNTQQALAGASSLIADRISKDVVLMSKIYQFMWQNSLLYSRQSHPKTSSISTDVLAKFSDYFDYVEPIKSISSHRIMAIMRGKKSGALKIKLQFSHEQQSTKPIIFIYQALNLPYSPSNRMSWLSSTIQQCWEKKILPKITTEIMKQAKQLAHQQAIEVFSNNLHDLLMIAPAGHHVTLGIDPGIRTGVKLAIIDQQSKLLATHILYPHPPKNQWKTSIESLKEIINQYHVRLVSIGNGTGSRETKQLVDACKKQYQLDIKILIVNEAGASVYSASELAAQEFPHLDVSLRGAISIARRLQDPLAELVKIEPKAIGVGQYQHDLNHQQLNIRLTDVIEDCVNAVGVDLNTASVSLLKNVSGLNATLANNIVAHRHKIGRFSNRNQLLDIPRCGPKTFEQAAAFLRINTGNNPLDASAVHPESYELVKLIAQHCNSTISQLLSHKEKLNKLNANDFICDKYGLPTIIDVISELKRPARDPRGSFKTAQLRHNIDTIHDLSLDMILEGTITNVTDFGAFVDIGIHQDGLIHISNMTNSFISNPRKIVTIGQIITVKVIHIDTTRHRIALSTKGIDQVPPQKHKK